MVEFYLYVFIFLLIGMFPGLNLVNGYITYKVINKFGFQKAGLFTVLTGVILLLVTDFGFIGIISALFGISSLLMILFQKKLNFNKRIFFVSVLLILIIMIFKFEVIFNYKGKLSERLFSYYSANKNQLNEQLKNISADRNNDEIFDSEEFFRKNLNLFVKVFPGIVISYFVSGILISAYLFYYLLYKSSLLKSGLKNIEHAIQDFTDYFINDHIIWIFIITFAGVLFTQKMEYSYYIFLNIMIVLLVLYYFQGICVLSYYLKKINFICH
ncbi:DUF2232 domain-containing protein [Candidatus Dependentiae bacterium]|nr:DUF2232 domain-containing protein [Candidatus Dependentiae bacterium]